MKNPTKKRSAIIEKSVFIGYILLLTYILFFSSCTTSKKITSEKQIKDSIVYVDKIRIDTIREKITINDGIDNEINFKCDSTALNQSYKSGGVQYRIIKEKGEIRFVIKKDSSVCVDKYQSTLKIKDSLQRVVNKSIQSKEIVRKPFLSDIWKIAFFVLLGFWILGITPLFIFRLIKPL